MVKLKIMIKQLLFVKNKFKIGQPPALSMKKAVSIKPGIYKTIIMIFLAFFIQLFMGSCKTCKCPAYSQIESQTPAKTGDATV